MIHNKIINTYLEKNGYPFDKYAGHQDFIPDVAVVIPCYKEGDISQTLASLYEAYKHAPVDTIVFVVINAPENCEAEVVVKNEASVQSIVNFMNICNHERSFRLEYIVLNNIPSKIAGVGWARKKGFDEILYKYRHTGANPVLIWFDADSSCATNFLDQVYSSFLKNPEWDAASIHFEHPIPQHAENHGRAIVEYELHLRIYIHFQLWSGLPFAFQTIGSSMAVKATSYAKNGGMSPKKAGEDFYFLHKIGDKGKVGQIRETKVFPSGRISDRVPFGTGKAIGDHLLNGKPIKTYHPESYKAIFPLWQHLNLLYEGKWHAVQSKLPHEVATFCIEQNIEQMVDQVRKNSSNYQFFQKRFFQWFNAFKYMKYLHHMRSLGGYEDCDVYQAFEALMKFRYPEDKKPGDIFQALLFLREKDRAGL